MSYQNQLQRVVMMPRTIAQQHHSTGLGAADFVLPSMPAPVIDLKPMPLFDTSGIQSIMRSVPTVVWIAGGALLLWWFSGAFRKLRARSRAKAKQRARSKAKAEYQRRLDEINREYATT